MWRRLWRGGSSASVLKQALSTAEATAPPVWRRRSSILLLPPPATHSYSSTGGRRIPLLYHHFSASSFCSASEKEKEKKEEGEHITCEEAKRLMRLVNVESLKTKLGTESSKEVIPYNQLVETCQAMGVARSPTEAAAFARVLDDAGVVLLFRDKVYLHPQKVVDLIRNAVPLALTPEDDPMRDELKMLQEKKDEIDVLAHKEVRRILWCGLGLAVMQVSLFFRLTFWEFSWDVMEPIAFFVTSSGIVVGYAYFLFTSRDPTYQDLMKRLFLSRQKKLFKKLNFNVDRFKELQQKCTVPLHSTTSKRKRVGWDLELVDN